MLLKKVFVVFPDPKTHVLSAVASWGEKTYETKKDHLHVFNKDDGTLVISDISGATPANATTLAVFKDWIYWEKLE